MSKYSPTLAQDLLKAEKDGVTLADYLQSAIGNAILEFTEEDNLAAFAMADDLLPGLLENFAALDFNRYETEENTRTDHNEKAPATAPTVNGGKELGTGSSSQRTPLAQVVANILFGLIVDQRFSDYPELLNVEALTLEEVEEICTRFNLSMDEVLTISRVEMGS